MDDSHIMSEAPQAAMFDSSNDARLVNYRPPRQDREVEVVTVVEPRQRPVEPPNRRRSSQRILPSIEMDDSDMPNQVFARNETILRPEDMALLQDPARSRLRYDPGSRLESRSQADVTNLKRARDEDEVYIISERRRAPATYEYRGRNAVVDLEEHAISSSIHQRGREPIYNDGPRVVEYDPRIVQLSTRAQEKIATPPYQSQPNFQPRFDKAGRPHELIQEPHAVGSLENRPIFHAQAFQRRSPPESHRMINVPSYENEHRHAPALQPAVSHTLHTESARDGLFSRHREELSRKVQYYDDQSGVLHNGAPPRREAVTYVSTPRAMG